MPIAYNAVGAHKLPTHQAAEQQIVLKHDFGLAYRSYEKSRQFSPSLLLLSCIRRLSCGFQLLTSLNQQLSRLARFTFHVVPIIFLGRHDVLIGIFILPKTLSEGIRWWRSAGTPGSSRNGVHER